MVQRTFDHPFESAVTDASVSSSPAAKSFDETQFPRMSGWMPLLGHLPAMWNGQPLQTMLARGRKSGPIFEIDIAGHRTVVVQDAALAAELCDEQTYEKKLPPPLVGLREIAGSGLFTAFSDEPEWELAHTLLRPAFTKQAMRSYHATMNQVCSELIAFWDRDAAAGPVPVAPALTKMTLETIARTSFSAHFDSFSSHDQHPYVSAMIGSLHRGRAIGNLSDLPFGPMLLRRGQERFDRQMAYVAQVLDDIIDRRREAQRAGEEPPTDLLGLMLNAVDENGLSLDQRNVRDQINTFLVAGHETTSGALSFTLYYLATHPSVLRKAQREVDDILGSEPDAEPTFEQVPKFRYLRRCLDEALRLWPTAPAFARGPRGDEALLGGRYLMKHDDWVLVLMQPIHTDPAIWGLDAGEFNPDHFAPQAVKKRPPHSYFPFGTGERACIGRQFALHEAVLVLARLLHRYDLRMAGGYRLKVEERLTVLPRDFDLTLIRRAPDSDASATTSG